MVILLYLYLLPDQFPPFLVLLQHFPLKKQIKHTWPIDKYEVNFTRSKIETYNLK